MTAEQRAIRDKCDALLADFDARHPEIVYAIECREVTKFIKEEEETIENLHS